MQKVETRLQMETYLYFVLHVFRAKPNHWTGPLDNQDEAEAEARREWGGSEQPVSTVIRIPARLGLMVAWTDDPKPPRPVPYQGAF